MLPNVFTVCRLLQVMLKVLSLSLALTVGHTVFQRFFLQRIHHFLAHPTYVLSTSWSIFTYLGKIFLANYIMFWPGSSTGQLEQMEGSVPCLAAP